MSDTKISGLTAKTTLHDTDLVPIVDVEATPDETKKITGANLKSQVIASDAEIAALAGLTSAADKLPYFTGDGTADVAAFTAAGRALVDDADAAAQKTTLSLNNVENTAHSTDAHTMTIDGRDVSVDGTKLDTIATSANAYTHPNHSGEVTSVADGAQTIANDAVTYAKMQNVSATDKVLGRSSAGAGDTEEIACTAAGRAILDDADASAQRTTLGLAIGTNVLAEQTIGIADDNLVEVDDTDAADDDYAKFTANGLEGREPSEVVSDILSSFADQLTGAHLSQTFGAAAGRLRNLLVTPIGGEVLRILGCGASPFDGDIAGAPNATTVVYDGETKESMFTGLATYDGSSYWGQIILHNTTRSNSRKIVSVNTGTNTITTTSSTDDWADDDVITCQSQTNAQAGYIDIEVSDNVATTTGSVFIFATFDDAEGNLDGNRYVMFHPFATYDQGKRQWLSATNASEKSSLTFPLQVVSQKFTVFLGSGCNGVNLVLAIKAEVEYADT